VREAGLFDKARLGRPGTATDKSRQERFEEMAQENHAIIQQDIAVTLGINCGWFLESLCQVGTMKIA